MAASELAALATTATDCSAIGLPFAVKAHLSSVTYPAALAATAYWWRDGVVAFLKDVNRDF